jgi:hypothetical protein
MATRKEQDEAARKAREEQAAQRASRADQAEGNPAEQGDDSSNPAGAPETPEPPQGPVVGTRPNYNDPNYGREHSRHAREAAQAGITEGGGAEADKDSNAAANANRSANSPNADATRQPGSSVTPMGTQDVPPKA